MRLSLVYKQSSSGMVSNGVDSYCSSQILSRGELNTLCPCYSDMSPVYAVQYNFSRSISTSSGVDPPSCYDVLHCTSSHDMTEEHCLSYSCKACSTFITLIQSLLVKFAASEIRSFYLRTIIPIDFKQWRNKRK